MRVRRTGRQVPLEKRGGRGDEQAAISECGTEDSKGLLLSGW